MNDILSKIAVSLLVRLRVEIGYDPNMPIRDIVSLLVRLRVEILTGRTSLIKGMSASS